MRLVDGALSVDRLLILRGFPRSCLKQPCSGFVRSRGDCECFALHEGSAEVTFNIRDLSLTQMHDTSIGAAFFVDGFMVVLGNSLVGDH